MNKLDGLPTIHYISIEESLDRRSNLEGYFEKYNITNYVPHIFTRYKEGDYEIQGPLVHLLGIPSKAANTSHFILLKKWYENNNDDFILVFEDDVSLETIEYWNFTWKEFEDNLPRDWNCIQLSLVNDSQPEDYRFRLRNSSSDWSAAAYLIKRKYVKYLLDRYYSNQVFNFDIKEFSCIPVIEQLLFLNELGGVYSFPLFCEDARKLTPVLGDFSLDFHKHSYDSIINWWKDLGTKLSLDCIMKEKINHIYDQLQFGENWFSYPNLYLDVVRKFSSGSKFVEVGCWKGKSSSFMAVEIANSCKNIEFYCVDTWEGSVEHKDNNDLTNLYDIFVDNMKSLRDYYVPIRMDSIRASQQFNDKSLDFVFIDASHEYEDVKKDILAWLPKVKDGGVIAGHDYYLTYDYFPGVKQAVHEIFNADDLIFSEDCWIYNVKYEKKVMNELIAFSLDTENGQKNYDLALWYESQGHTAPAHTYYLRSSERSDNKNLAYKSLIRASFCYKSQGSRDFTEKSLLENALMLLPKRPEAYYFLSLMYESKGEWQNCYIYSSLGLECYEYDIESIDIPEYSGKHLLIYQKAISSWWWGKGQESRDLFKELAFDYWNDLSDFHQKSVEDNISRLGLTPYSQSEIIYTKDKHDSLRFKFCGSENIEKNYSQILQDIFVLSILNGKRGGKFLEVGGAKPFERNNTALLEQSFDWTGVSIELNEEFANEYKESRQKTKVFCTDALTINYKKLLENEFDVKEIDYLQLDIEPAKNTFEVLMSIPFNDYKFAVITYEHDYYIDVTRSYRDKSRDYLKSMGYRLVVSDLSTDGVSNFEDWWIHPDLVDPKILNVMEDISIGTKNAGDYMYKNVEYFKKRRVIDYFRFFNEKELLELRYHLLKDKVDKFIISQGTKTFSGNQTELLAEKYIKELNLPEDKFIVINVDLPENDSYIQNSEIDIVFRSFSGPSTDSHKNSLNTRTRERMVMDGLTSVLSQFDEDDIFLVSDCDEIINPKYIDELVDTVVDNPKKLVKVSLVELQGKANLKVYDLSTSSEVRIDHVSYICTKKHFNVCSPTQLRYNIFNPFETIHLYKNGEKVDECGWHFSWMGDSNRKKLKCKSFAHYSDYIDSAIVKDLASTQIETFFDEWKPSVDGINPWGNTNLILKKYDESNLPKEIWKLKNVREYLLGSPDDLPSKKEELVDLFLKGNYNTDKYELGYITEFYNDVLKSLREDPINLLEIGTYNGGSIKMWKDYFHPHSNIFTGDIVQCQYETEGVKYIYGDLYSDEIVSQFNDEYFNLIIDDGPHTLESFELVIKKYYSKLKPNGTLIIEDVVKSSFISPLISLAKQNGYSSYEIIDMSNKQINEEWRNDWKSGLYILRFDK